MNITDHGFVPSTEYHGFKRPSFEVANKDLNITYLNK
jgi:hypothetical protein